MGSPASWMTLPQRSESCTSTRTTRSLATSISARASTEALHQAEHFDGVVLGAHAVQGVAHLAVLVDDERGPLDAAPLAAVLLRVAPHAVRSAHVPVRVGEERDRE